MTCLIVIPARGGSKRLPNKNLRTVGGLSLVGHAVKCGLALSNLMRGVPSAVACDTDSEAIAAEARAHGAIVPFLRASEYAKDDTPSALSVIQFGLRWEAANDGYGPATIVLLQPTSPLRVAEDALLCLKAHVFNERPVYSIDEDTGEPSGAVYVTRAGDLVFQKTFTPDHAIKMPMPHARSVDVNTAEDLAEAERLWKVQHG